MAVSAAFACCLGLAVMYSNLLKWKPSSTLSFISGLAQVAFSEQ